MLSVAICIVFVTDSMLITTKLLSSYCMLITTPNISANSRAILVVQGYHSNKKYRQKIQKIYTLLWVIFVGSNFLFKMFIFVQLDQDSNIEHNYCARKMLWF